MHEKNVSVRIIADTLNIEKNHVIFKRFVDLGIPCIVKGKEKGLMHNKFAILDKSIVLTGSFNWTYYAASLNHENMLIMYEQ